MAKIDLIAAGAPKLPDGRFYRISPCGLFDAVSVQIRRSLPLIGSVREAESVVWIKAGMTAEAAAVGACTRVYAKWKASQPCREIHAFYGDHA